ncbi:Ribonuclease R [Metamycoplasma auris 15026]|uniref:Ribonuclease R n=1 Tax=Metamycoplasma auris 15026 TaxID=1188233 RepID=N9VBB6_9BACT|nr:ribonuclease R [Metamycoplasma auris]ENY68676.1 Ribonuclease R [Metamycoplasma auris 15026]
MKFEHKYIKNLDSEEILKLIQNNPMGLSFLEIVKKLKINPENNHKLSFLLKQFILEDKIEISRDQKYTPLFYLKEVEKEISISTKRLGFIDFEEENDTLKQNKSAILFPHQIKNLLVGDLVRAKIFSYYSSNKELLYKAKITKVICHKQKNIIGLVSKNNFGRYIFEAINEKNKANFEIINYSSIPKNITDKDVIEAKVLEPNEKNVAILFSKIIDKVNSFDFPFKKIFSENEIVLNFPEETIKKAKGLPKEVTENELKNRIDLRNLITVTIDGLDTKDFDDAISCYRLPNSNTKLFIHIADVSHYVQENDAIDNEALRRGTSIYLPDKVIPMLPFELSNGICSLNPKVNRCTLTLELEIDNQGNNVDQKIYESIINSDYRLTYNEVNDFFDNKIDLPNEIKKTLIDSAYISDLIRSKKNAEGYVNFEIKEPKIIMQDNKVVDIKIKKEGRSENMIEDFMVRANETIAHLMSFNNFPSIYRIHDKPSDEKLFELQELINFSGLKNINVPFDGEPLSFAKMVEKIKSQNFDDFIKNALLRTMQKAIYSSKNIGHFGLASEYYSHFTSPIRRYPDLLLHRLIKKYLIEKKKLSEDEYKKEEAKIEDIAIQNCESERIAMTVERDIVDIRKAEFFEPLVDKVFDATVVSIEKFGIFLNIEDYQTSVLIHFDELNDNVIKISNFEAKGKNYYFKVGMKQNIQIKSIDRNKGNINAKLC